MLKRIHLTKALFQLLALIVLNVSINIAQAMETSFSMTAKSATFSGAGSASLFVSVVNQDGELVFSQSSNGTPIEWTLVNDITDGSYKFEITMSDIAPGKNSRDRVSNHKPNIVKKTGFVRVSDGKFVMEEIEESENTEEESVWRQVKSYSDQLARSAIEFLIPAAHADVLQNDDLIVVGSQCVGIDCVNGETFNFDTVILKENNLRVFFNDTSRTGSFPSTDWRLIVNETVNGGANLFAIEDSTAGNRIFTIDGGAPTNSLYIDRTGRIGIGTSNPATLLDLVNGDTPTVRLTQNGSSGWSPQTWDLVGNEVNFFVRDATNGSKLPFRIETGAPTNALYVDSTGNIGIGQANPTEALHVIGNAIVSGNLELGSSRFIKQEIKDLALNEAINTLSALEPVMFKYKHSPEQQSIGFIAEDVPDLVATEKRNSLRPMDIVAVLTKVVQEQQKTINELSTKLDTLIEQE
ncbi:MAG: tail fiber domain-containing protein [Gammaproteobacteria bacterium]|nr:tail fiber domain-containing protein [Gammaproteobacteria bacterium]